MNEWMNEMSLIIDVSFSEIISNVDLGRKHTWYKI